MCLAKESFLSKLKHSPAFTLAELLIALAILGVIAVFTIPKLLQSQKNNQLNSITKEAMGAISEAYQAYRQQNTPTAGMTAKALIPYFNYVAADSVGNMSIDFMPTGTGSVACASNEPCVRLHNGAILFFRWPALNGTASTNCISFILDPDGKVTNNADSIKFHLYYNGRITTRGTALANSNDTEGTYGPDPSQDPPWFSWN